jgi:UDP-glucose 4-epimerase
MSWHNKRVLVTGASGFLGGHLLAALAGGAEVFATSRSERHDQRARWFKIDLANPDAVTQLFLEVHPHLVFHLSSKANGYRDISLVREVFEAEVLSTLSILLACAAAPVERLILPGSLEEPDGSDAPSSPFAAAKASSTLYSRMFHLLYEVPTVHTRLFMCYGKGQPDWKVIPYAISCLRRGECPKIASPDRQVDWIYAPDAIEGLLASSSIRGLEGCSVDIGSGHFTTIGDVVGILGSIINPTLTLAFGPGAPRAYEQVKKADVGRTEALTGWRAQTSLLEGLRLTVE